ncbi:MAG: hypothetical protein M1282_02120 [Chloroflexi bacterium]|nr:hypothetical protein [Chloroflexota bacterium]
MKKKRASKDVLLVEYQTCMADMSQCDSDMWQASGIFIGLSIIGFSILIQSQAQNWLDFSIYILLSVFGLFLLFIWHHLTSGWLRLIHINIYRMRQIESSLGMEREGLIAYLDTGDGRGAKDTPDLEKLCKEFPVRQFGGPLGTRISMSWLIRLITTGWFLLIIKQFVFLLIN